MRSIVSGVGAANPEVQKVTNKALGPDVFQVSSKQLQPRQGGAGALRR